MTPDSIRLFRELWHDYRTAMRRKRTEETRRMYRRRVRVCLRWVRSECKEAA